MSRQADTDALYLLVDRLQRAQGGPLTVADTPSGGWPSHGVYFFFEPGEVRSDGSPRCVRVGTHALTATSKSTLRRRLRQHRGILHSGGGNHRGSIFRGHVGAALIARGDVGGLPLDAWRARVPDPALRETELAAEQAVSQYIRQMPVVCVGVPTRSDRGLIESGAIALLSAYHGGVDVASPGWLGRSSVAPWVVRSGLWNVRGVDDATYDAGFLAVLARHVPR